MDAVPDPLAGDVLYALIGPTASGKSALALQLAERCGAEIVSLDSMQVYRGMDVGTAKPSADDRARVRHHLLDVADPRERYDVHRWLADLGRALADIRARRARALCVGGAGFYLKALVDGLFRGPDVDPALRASLEQRARDAGPAALHAELARVDPPSAARIHANDVKRVVRALEVHAQTGKPLSEWQTQWRAPSERPRKIVGLEVAPDELDVRIRARARAMLDGGWPEEAARLAAAGGLGPTAAQALGYAEALAVHEGRMTRADALAAIALQTRQFARSQRTWWRKLGSVTWISAGRFSPETGAPADLADEARRALGW